MHRAAFSYKKKSTITLLEKTMKSNYLSTNSLKRKKLFFCLSAGFLLGTCLVSCELEDFEEPLEETYTKSFIKNFGLIDQNQDWNMATRAEVSVTTDEPSHIKVYGRVDGDYRLMGDFLDVTGSQKLQFDTPRGVTDLLVSDGSTSLSTTVGQSVNFASMQTRAINPHDGTDNPLGVKVEQTDTYEYVYNSSSEDKTGIFYYRNKLPESQCNVNVEGVTTNFKYTTGDKGYSFLVFPIYWQTNNTVEMGVKYMYNEEINYVSIYTIKSGDQLQYGSGRTYVNQQTIKSAESTDWPVQNKTWENYTDEDKELVKKYIADKISKENESYKDVQVTDLACYTEGTIQYSANYYDTNCTWTSFNGNETAIWNKQLVRSQGIKVTLPANTEFSFYLKETEGYTFSSIVEENETVNSVHVPHVCTFLNSDSERCIGFEDWYGKYDTNEPDLNDLIIYTTLATPENPTPEIKDVQSYILAAEDLGNMDDFDFNDMVIKVSTPMENTESTGDDDKYKIEVTALAAGGTLPLKLCREGEVITSPVEGLDDEASEQFHSWFGTGKISSSTMINTYSVSTEGHTRTIYLSEKEKNAFSMSSYTTDVAKSMGGFSFKVQRSEEEGYTTEVKAPENGKAPQMICVPDTWKWPTERTNISKAYPDFGTWGGNYTNTEWIKNYEDEKVLP